MKEVVLPKLQYQMWSDVIKLKRVRETFFCSCCGLIIEFTYGIIY